MKVFLIGKKSLAVEVLSGVLPLAEVIGVSCPPFDKLEEAAAALGVENSKYCDKKCDLIVMANAQRYVGPGEISNASIGAISFHPSLLPRHRGIDAVRWTVAFGDAVTGGTVYWLNDTYDAGPVFSQQVVFRQASDDYHRLWRSMFPVGVGMLIEAVRRISEGDRAATPQNELYATSEPPFKASL